MVPKIYLRLKGKFNLEIVAFIKNQKKISNSKNYLPNSDNQSLKGLNITNQNCKQ